MLRRFVRVFGSMFDIHFTNMPAFIVVLRDDGFYFQDANDAFLAFRNQSGNQLVGRRVLDCSPAGLGERLVQHYAACAETNLPSLYEIEFALGSGCCFWQTTLVPIAAPGARSAKSMIGFCHDRTEEWLRRRAHEELNQVLTSVMRSATGGFWVYDIAGDRFEASASLSELVTGTDRLPLSLADYRTYVHPEDIKLAHGLIPPPEGQVVEFRICAPDKGIRWLQSRRRLIVGEDGTPRRVIAFVTDITDQRSKLSSLQEEANTDALTGLRNRRSFDKVWADTFAYARSARSAAGLVLLDVDGFKPINDRYGHRTGDRILKKIGHRIARQARKSDQVARIGGDEFAIVMRDSSQKGLESLAKRIRETFEHPFQVDGHSIMLGVSTGIAMAQGSDETDTDVFERADQQLYAMKAAHKSGLLCCG